MCTHASNERTSSVSSRVSPRPRQIAVRSGLATAHARFASTESRHSATASSRSRPAKRGSSASVRATISSSSRSSIVGRAEVLREQALLRGHVHDQVVRGQPVRRDDVERVVGQIVDGPLEALRQRQVDVDHRVGAARPAGAARASSTPVAHPTGRFGRLGGTEPRGDARQAVGLAREVGPACQHRLDRRGLVGFARVERVRAEQLLDLGLGQLVRAHHSPPSASRVTAMRRSAEPQPRLGRPLRDAERLRDLPVGLAAEVRELHRSALLVGKQVERGAHPLGGEERGGHLLDVGRGDRATRLPLGPPAPRLLAPHVVDRAAVGQRAEPGAQAAPRAGSNAAGRSQKLTNTSWLTSSAAR